MDLHSKVLELPNICGLEIDLSANILPTQLPSVQNFYNSYIQNSTAVPVYFTPSKVRLSEIGENNRAGMEYTQTLRFDFPSNDINRSNRIKDYQKLNYVYIKLSNEMIIFFGRNDYYQNSSPKVKVVGNEKTTQIIYTCKSMFPLGFVNTDFSFGLPSQFSLNFFNLL